MKKRLTALALALCLALTLLPPAALAAGVAAVPSSTKLMVNGKAVAADAYLINQNNYIKLRDLATMINGTGKNFEVSWDGAKNAINLISSTKYTPTAGDMTPGDGQNKTATPSTSKIFVDGVETPLTAYVIGQNNYFQLRDVMKTFNVYVGWDQATGTATLDTSKGYEGPAAPVTIKANLTEKNIEGQHFRNAFYHDYLRPDTGEGRAGNHANIPTSYLLQTDDGGFMRVVFDGGELGKGWSVVANYYDKDMKLLSAKTKIMPQELTAYGGFYAGKDSYFLLSGEYNESLDDQKETYRVVRYDKNWTRLGQISFSDTYTTRPFAASNASMVEYDGRLYIHTGHEMYPDDNGLCHQADLTLVADLATMKPCGISNFETALETGNWDKVLVSHSFNQLILEADGELYTASHGDYTPRSMQVSKRNLADISQGNTCAPFLPFWGNKGNNNTGAELGGLEASASSILTVGTTRDQNVIDVKTHDGKLNNVFVAVSPRSDIKAGTTITYLTDYPKGAYCAGNPFLVKLNNDRFMLLWNEKPAVNDAVIGYRYHYTMFNSAPVLCYTYLDGKGAQIAPIVKTRGELSDCQPILTTDNRVVWTAPREGQEKFFSIPVDDLSGMKPVTPGTGSDTIVKNDWESGWNTISTGGNYLYVNSEGDLELNSAGKDSALLITNLGNMTITIQTLDMKYLAHEGVDPKDFARIVLTDKPFHWNVHRQPDGSMYITPWTTSNRYLYFDGKTADGSPAMLTKDIYRFDRQSDRCPFQFSAAPKPAARPSEDDAAGPLKDGQYTIGLMDNFLSINADGIAELQSSAKTTKYKLTGKGGKQYTIQTSDGNYLAPYSEATSGVKLVASHYVFIWDLYPAKDNTYSLRVPESRTLVALASEGRRGDGTPIVFGEFDKRMDAPPHTEFTFILQNSAPVEPDGAMISYRRTRSTFVDSILKPFGCYDVDGTLCVGIADIARLLTKTDKKFNFTVDKEKNTLNIIPGGTFTSNETETANTEESDERKTYRSTLTVLLDGTPQDMALYEIEGLYCVPISDLAKTLDMKLKTQMSTVSLYTSLPYGAK